MLQLRKWVTTNEPSGGTAHDLISQGSSTSQTGSATEFALPLDLVKTFTSCASCGIGVERTVCKASCSFSEIPEAGTICCACC